MKLESISNTSIIIDFNGQGNDCLLHQSRNVQKIRLIISTSTGYGRPMMSASIVKVKH
jgi:hypothetical protein